MQEGGAVPGGAAALRGRRDSRAHGGRPAHGAAVGAGRRRRLLYGQILRRRAGRADMPVRAVVADGAAGGHGVAALRHPGDPGAAAAAAGREGAHQRAGDAPRGAQAGGPLHSSEGLAGHGEEHQRRRRVCQHGPEPQRRAGDRVRVPGDGGEAGSDGAHPAGGGPDRAAQPAPIRLWLQVRVPVGPGGEPAAQLCLPRGAPAEEPDVRRHGPNQYDELSYEVKEIC